MPTTTAGKAKHPKTSRVTHRTPRIKAKAAPAAAEAIRTVGTERYFAAVGRRKTAVARVRLTPSKTPGFIINDKPLATYFGSTDLQEIAVSPLTLTGKTSEYLCSVKVNGGGLHGQAEAIRHGISRSLLLIDAALRPALKPFGYLSRDSRMKERKKPGLKRARRAPQWSKR